MGLPCEASEMTRKGQVWFQGSNASGGRIVLLPRRILGARCFQNGHFGAHLFYSVLFFSVQSLGGHASAKRVSHELCFRQAHCFVQGPLRFLPVPRHPTGARSHIWGFPTSLERKTWFAQKLLGMQYSRTFTPFGGRSTRIHGKDFYASVPQERSPSDKRLALL